MSDHVYLVPLVMETVKPSGARLFDLRVVYSCFISMVPLFHNLGTHVFNGHW